MKEALTATQIPDKEAVNKAFDQIISSIEPRLTTDFHEDPVGQYLNQINRYPLLTSDQEIALARAMEFGKDAQSTLEKLSVAGALTPGIQEELEDDVKKGHEARELFVNCNLRLVVKFAKNRNVSRESLELIDLINAGNQGLMKATDMFDWRLGYKFSTYAANWIKQSIQREIENTDRVIRIPVHAEHQLEQFKISYQDLIHDLKREPTIEELAQYLELPREKIIELMEIEKVVISLDAPVSQTEDETSLHSVIESKMQTTEKPSPDLFKLPYLTKMLTPLEQDIAFLISSPIAGIGHHERENFAVKILGIQYKQFRKMRKEIATKLENHTDVETIDEPDFSSSLVRENILSEHWGEGLSFREIAAKYRTSVDVIFNMTEFYSIKTRKMGRSANLKKRKLVEEVKNNHALPGESMKELFIRTLKDEGDSLSKACKKLGIKIRLMSDWCRDLDIEIDNNRSRSARRRKLDMTDEILETIEAKYKTETLTDIALELGISYDRVSKVMKSAGKQPRSRSERNILRADQKRKAQIETIVKKFAREDESFEDLYNRLHWTEGMSFNTICKMFHVSPYPFMQTIRKRGLRTRTLHEAAELLRKQKEENGARKGNRTPA